jgi:hypothetical protein
MAKRTATTKKYSEEVGCLLLFAGFLLILIIARSGGYSIIQVISNIVAQFGIHNTG